MEGLTPAQAGGDGAAGKQPFYMTEEVTYTGTPNTGDIEIRPYRKKTKIPVRVAEREAFEARLRMLQKGYKSKLVGARAACSPSPGARPAPATPAPWCSLGGRRDRNCSTFRSTAPSGRARSVGC